MAFRLAELFIEFTTRGVDQFRQGMEKINTELEGTQKAIDNLKTGKFNEMIRAQAELVIRQNKFNEALRRQQLIISQGRLSAYAQILQQKLAPQLNAVRMVGLGAAASLTALTMSGIRASAFGELFGYQMERLSLTLAGLFRPELQAVYDWFSRLTTKIQDLNEQQRESIVLWTQGALVFKGTLSVLQVFAPFLSTLARLLLALSVGFGVASGDAGEFWKTLQPLVESLWEIGKSLASVVAPLFNSLKNILVTLAPVIIEIAKLFEHMAKIVENTVGPVMKFIGGLLDGVMSVFRTIGGWIDDLFGTNLQGVEGKLIGLAVGDTKQNRGTLSRRTGGVESINAAWERFAAASIKATAGGGKSIEDRQLEELEKQTMAVNNVEKAVRGMKPAVV